VDLEVKSQGHDVDCEYKDSAVEVDSLLWGLSVVLEMFYLI
jgi:hypothetical protein